MVVCAPALAQAPVQIARTLKPGAVSRYRAVITTEIQNMPVRITAVRRVQVETVKPDGTAREKTIGESGQMLLGGQKQPWPADPPIEYTLDPRNEVSDIKITPGDQPSVLPEGLQKLMVIATQVILPPAPVAPGGTWHTQIDDPAAPGKKIDVQGTYVGEETRQGVPCWKIQQSLTPVISPDGGTMKYAITAWLETSDGADVQEDGETIGMPNPISGGPMNVSSHVVRLKLGEDAAAAGKAP